MFPFSVQTLGMCVCFSNQRTENCFSNQRTENFLIYISEQKKIISFMISLNKRSRTIYMALTCEIVFQISESENCTYSNGQKR